NAETWFDGPGAVAKGFADEHSGAPTVADEHRASFREIAARARQRLSALSPMQIAAAPQKREEVPMFKNAAAAPPATDPTAVLAAERTRRADIRARFGRFGDAHRALLDECLDDPAISADAASAKLLAKLGERHEPIVPHASHG